MKLKTTYAGRDVGKGNIHPLLVGVQASKATMEISVAVSQEDGNQFTSQSSHTTPGHIPKGLYTLQQRSWFIQAHCCQNLEQPRRPLTDCGIFIQWNVI